MAQLQQAMLEQMTVIKDEDKSPEAGSITTTFSTTSEGGVELYRHCRLAGDVSGTDV